MRKCGTGRHTEVQNLPLAMHISLRQETAQSARGNLAQQASRIQTTAVNVPLQSYAGRPAEQEKT
jgi:hypothetical protein